MRSLIENTMTGRALCFAAAIAFATPAPSQVPTSEPSLSPPTTEQILPVAATDEEMEQARGGWVWVVVIVGLRASQITIRMCASRASSCASGAEAVFTSAAAARRWVCNRYRRFC